ncbi:hypothetical protein NHX12_004279 [Muraenolepis orangiensis]|uniref:Immunoglobulin V-set domain-containing protein n=1 Tax=Muraenolepis orangiensis TaxID=630683 RepID=A0A9Q0DUY3_9TELE|nr:hypothetical protein NHX12_004279 [Muraenolepis orangiensis]
MDNFSTSLSSQNPWERPSGLKEKGKVGPLNCLTGRSVNSVTTGMSGENRESSVADVCAKFLCKMVEQDKKLTFKSKVKLARLSPCPDALKPHVQRVNHRVALYKQSDESILQETKPYEKQGWMRTDEGVHSVDLNPVKNEENTLEGTAVTLSYRFSRTATGSDDFFWYRQYPGEPPQPLLYISGFERTAMFVGSDKRFSTKLTEKKTGVDLEISSAAVSDSALYYCAMRPTVTGNTDSLYTNLLSTKHVPCPLRAELRPY